MNRYAKEKREYHPKPIRRIELDDANPVKKLIGVAIALCVAVAALGFAINGLLSVDPGLMEIEYAGAEKSCAEDFTLLYEVGTSGVSATAEKKAVSLLYTQLCEEAYDAMSLYDEPAGMPNLRYLNTHPNETVTVSDFLYESLAAMTADGSRRLYLAPVSAEYESLFSAADETARAELDPEESPETQEYFALLLPMIASSEHISLEFLGENRVKLHISEEYLALAREYELEQFVGFGYLRNAFIADFMAESFLAKGYPKAVILSADGCARCLLESAEGYVTQLYTVKGNACVPCDELRYASGAAVCFYACPIADEPGYALCPGGMRTRYVTLDGKSRTSVESIAAQSETLSCAELALALSESFAADEFTMPSVSAAWVIDGVTQRNN